MNMQEDNEEANDDVCNPNSDEHQRTSQSVSRDKYLENATTSYFINDFKINDIPETNPLQSVINEFVKKR